MKREFRMRPLLAFLFATIFTAPPTHAEKLLLGGDMADFGLPQGTGLYELDTETGKVTPKEISPRAPTFDSLRPTPAQSKKPPLLQNGNLFDAETHAYLGHALPYPQDKPYQIRPANTQAEADAQYEALPPDSWFKTPNGELRHKPALNWRGEVSPNPPQQTVNPFDQFDPNYHPYNPGSPQRDAVVACTRETNEAVIKTLNMMAACGEGLAVAMLELPSSPVWERATQAEKKQAESACETAQARVQQLYGLTHDDVFGLEWNRPRERPGFLGRLTGAEPEPSFPVAIAYACGDGVKRLLLRVRSSIWVQFPERFARSTSWWGRPPVPESGRKPNWVPDDLFKANDETREGDLSALPAGTLYADGHGWLRRWDGHR